MNAVNFLKNHLFSAKHWREQRAQAMVEFALILPLFLLLVFGLIEFGRLMAIYTLISGSSSDAARYGAGAGKTSGTVSVRQFLDCAGIREIAKRNSFLVPIEDSGISIWYDTGDNNHVLGQCGSVTAEQILPNSDLGYRITVQVTAWFEPIVPMVGLQRFPITSTTTRTLVIWINIEGTPPPDSGGGGGGGGGGATTLVYLGQTSASVNESGGSVTLNVMADPAPTSAVTVYFLYTGDATYNTDYADTPMPVTIAAGATQASVTINITNDTADEIDEVAILTIAAVTNADIGSPKEYQLTIIDDDNPPNVYFATAAQSMLENQGMTVAVSLSHVSGKEISVPFTVAGTALSPDDYTISASPLVIPAGQSGGLISIAVVGDVLDEDDETVIITLGTPTNAALGSPNVHTATILDDDEAPTVSFNMAQEYASEAIQFVTFRVELSAASSKPVTVPYVQTGTALNPADYTIAPAASVLIPAGSLSANIVISIVADSDEAEGDETILSTMGTPVNATKGAITVHTVLIQAKLNQPTVSFGIDSSSALESAGTATILVQLSNPWTATVTVPFSVIGGTALNPDDYTLSASPLTFPVGGGTQQTILVTINNDTLYELAETVSLKLGTPTQATLGTITQHVFTIDNDDSLPTLSISISPSSGTEAIGVVPVVFHLSAASSLPVTVNYTVDATVASAATRGYSSTEGDYQLTASPTTIPAGSTSASVNLTVRDDVVYGEATEYVKVDLGAPTNAQLGTTNISAQFAIFENDACPNSQVQISGPGLNESKFSITISNPSPSPVYIASLQASWVDSPAQQLESILMDTVTIWDTTDGDPPTDIPTEGAWAVADGSRQINGNSATILWFFFKKVLVVNPATDNVVVRLNNGCVVTAVR